MISAQSSPAAMQHFLQIIVSTAAILLVFSSIAATEAGPAVPASSPLVLSPTTAHHWTSKGQLFAQSSYYYADYKVPSGKSPLPAGPPPPQKKVFVPQLPLECPDTGRTLCEVVDKYPAETVFEIVTTTQSDKFNFTSFFMDEGEGDQEPHFPQAPPPPPPPPTSYGKTSGTGYVVYQTAVRYDVPSTKAVNDYSYYGPPPAYNHHNQQPPPSYGHHHHQQQQQPPRGQYGPPPTQQRPIQYPQDNVRTPDGHRGGNYGGNHGGGNFNQRYRRVVVPNAPVPEVEAPQSIWRPFYPSASSAGHHQSQSQSPSRHHVQAHSRYKRQLDDDEEAVEVCRVQQQFISPRAALNDKSQWKYIVNIPERDPRLKQVVKVDICSRPNEPCSSQISLPFGFVSRCKQKYVKKKLLALDDDGQGTSTDHFFVPSCCVCEIVRG